MNRDVAVGVNLGHLSKVLACGSKGRSLTLEFKGGSMDVSIGREDDDRHQKNSVTLMEIESAAMSIPDMDDMGRLPSLPQIYIAT